MCLVFLLMDYAEDVENAGSNIWNCFEDDGAQSKREGAKKISKIFCDTFLTGRRAVLAQ